MKTTAFQDPKKKMQKIYFHSTSNYINMRT